MALTPKNDDKPKLGDVAPEIASLAPTKGERKPASPRAAYFVMQILGSDGQPVTVDKSRIRLVSVERDADKVLALIDSGEHPNAVYVRGMVPAGR